MASGHVDPDAADIAEMFDGVHESWQAISSLSEPRQGHAMLALADGGVLVAGGDTTRLETRGGRETDAVASSQKLNGSGRSRGRGR